MARIVVKSAAIESTLPVMRELLARYGGRSRSGGPLVVDVEPHGYERSRRRALCDKGKTTRGTGAGDGPSTGEAPAPPARLPLSPALRILRMHGLCEALPAITHKGAG